MKKTILLLTILAFSVSAFAQKPVKGNLLTEVNVSLNQWTNELSIPNLRFRYFIADDLAVRADLSVSGSSAGDSELIAVYIAQKMREGASLEEGMKDSLSGLDGVFTYFVATKDSLGMAKDTMAAKPLVLYESDDLVAMGSEEIAIRSVLPQEIDTYDPFDGEVKVWQI